MRPAPLTLLLVAGLVGCPWVSELAHEEAREGLPDDSSVVEGDTDTDADTDSDTDTDADTDADTDTDTDADTDADSDADTDSDTDTDTGTFVDEDRDGYGEAADCDDSDATVYPGADEYCDSTDSDCDGLTDDEDEDALDGGPWYADSDGDGYGDPKAISTLCLQPSGTVINANDCDDSSSTVYPGADEVGLNGVDDDCSGGDGTSLELDLATVSFTGEASGDKAGASLAFIGDIDGDGSGDLAVGAPGYDGGAGRVYLAYGPHSGGTVSLSTAGHLDAAGSGDAVGSAVAGADVDLDGYANLILGVPGHSADLGCVFLYEGAAKSGTTVGTGAYGAFPGDNTSDQLGSFVGVGGDLTGDGLDDFLVGAPYADNGYTNNGVAYVLSGRATGTSTIGDAAVAELSAWVNSSWTGHSMAGVGDVDGDGLDDLLVGAPRAEDGSSPVGGAFLVPGPVSGDIMLSITMGTHVVISGTGTNAYAGWSVAGPGDVDGDGYDDLLVGAPNEPVDTSYQGKAALVFGDASPSSTTVAAAPVVFEGADGDKAGWSVGAPGDLDGDSKPDIAIGAAFADDGATDGGAVYLLLGPTTGTYTSASAQGVLVGSSASDTAGYVMDAGDLDADGVPDLLVGAPDFDGVSTTTGAGSAHLVLGITF